MADSQDAPIARLGHSEPIGTHVDCALPVRALGYPTRQAHARKPLGWATLGVSQIWFFPGSIWLVRIMCGWESAGLNLLVAWFVSLLGTGLTMIMTWGVAAGPPGRSASVARSFLVIHALWLGWLLVLVGYEIYAGTQPRGHIPGP